MKDNPSSIPEYYRKYQSSKAEKTDEEKKGEKLPREQAAQSTRQEQETQKSSPFSYVKDKTIVFQGNGFTINQLEDWQDKILYTLTGPVTDGIQHNVIIDVEKDTSFESAKDYAEWHIQTLENELKSCMLLKKGEKKLTNGIDAYEAIFSWYPTDELRIYQQQIFVLVEKTAFKMTASYTKKTRKTLGPAVERMMLSFNCSVDSK
jgi:hypothetical protein